jgi:hypothetical protein
MHPLDALLWNSAASATAGSPRERDFLRAAHSSAWLKKLRADVQRAIGWRVAVTSIWVDTAPIARFSNGTSKVGCELGDLAIIFRVHGQKVFRRRMCILQGKVDKRNWQNGKSSKNQRALYEQLPPFDLHRAPASPTRLGHFDLQRDLTVPVSPAHPFQAPFPRLAFLLFDYYKAMPITPSFATIAWPSHSQTRMSFVDGLILQARAALAAPPVIGTPQPLGADVGNGLNPEWTNLYRTLLREALRKPSSSLPGGKWVRAIGFAQRATSIQALKARLAVMTHPLHMNVFGGSTDMLTSLQTTLYEAELYDGTRVPIDGDSTSLGDDPPQVTDGDQLPGGRGGMSMLLIDIFGDQTVEARFNR